MMPYAKIINALKIETWESLINQTLVFVRFRSINEVQVY